CRELADLKHKTQKLQKKAKYNLEFQVIDVDWGLVVKLALPEKVTRRAYKIFEIYDRFLTKVHFK
ncbi:unnamed protein product, partial [Tenebrio molitor]